MPKEQSQRKMQKPFIIGMFLICFLFLWWKSSYGYIFNDEPYILTLGDRLTKGNQLLISEWRPAQLTGYLLYPFLCVYRLLHTSTDGMILTFRHIYVLGWSMVVLFCYLQIKNQAKNKWATVAATLYLWLFASLDQMTLSYNFFSLSGIMICIALWIKPHGSITYFWIGIFYSIAVLACPYLAVLYFAYVFVYFLSLFKSAIRIRLKDHIFLKGSFLYIGLGVLLSVCLFAAFCLLRGGSIQEILESLPFILGDNEYPIRSLGQRIFGYIKVFAYDYRIFMYPSAILILLSLWDKKHQLEYFIIHSFWFFCALLILYLNYSQKFNFIMVPVCLLGLQAMLLHQDSDYRIKTLFYLGLVYSAVLFCSSNLGATAVAMGLSVSGYASFYLIDSYIYSVTDSQKNEQRRKVMNYLLIWICTAQIGVQSCYRYAKYYWDSDVWDLKERIETGPAEGIYTTPSQAQEYNSISQDIQQIPPKSKLLVLSLYPWIYLANDSEYATYSSWITGGTDYYMARLSTYYSLHPDKLPDYVYVLKEDDNSGIANSTLILQNYTRNSTGISVIYINKEIGK